MSQSDKQRIEAIWEERQSKVLLLEAELAGLQSQINSIDQQTSQLGMKSGEALAEYASYRRRLKSSLTAVSKKLADARQEFEKADERLKNYAK